MDQLQSSTVMPHIVYPPSVSESKIHSPHIIHLSHPTLSADHSTKLYQQAITTEPVRIQVSELDNNHQIQNHIMMSCQQTHTQDLPSVTIQSQTPSNPPLQFASQIMMPQLPVFQNEPYIHYNGYVNEQTYGEKEEDPLAQVSQDKNDGCDQKSSVPSELQSTAKRKRGMIPNPSTWACNIRKVNHQSGVAYVSRRGKFVPERKIKSTKNCVTTCKFECNKKISDTDRELIFKAFYSLTANEKKHFLLNTTERHDVRHPNSFRRYTFKYYFLVRGTRHSVCKNFYLGTLSISQKPVYNVHAGKSELNIPKPDGRGLSPGSYHGLPSTVKDSVREHIMSFKTVDSSPVKQFSKKQQHLQRGLSVKQMYDMYVSQCNSRNEFAVKQSMYRKILNQEFNIHFAKSKYDLLCAKCKEPIKKKGSDVDLKVYSY